MFELILNNLKKAWKFIKDWSGLIYQRVKVEIAVLKIIQEIKEIDRRIENLYELIGRRFLELKERHEKNILRDEEMAKMILEIQKLSGERQRLLDTASKIAEIKDTEVRNQGKV